MLAAGHGRRLRPLTRFLPKALCPIANVPLVDLAIERIAGLGDVAVNVHDHRDAMEEHLAGRAHLSVEEGEPLGTAGALGQLRGWLDGRAALVVNADVWCPGSLASFVATWDGARIRLLLVGDDALQPRSRVAGALLPWSAVAGLEATPSGLYEVSWRDAAGRGALDVVRHDGAFVDCGTPEQYLAANLQASGGANVVGAGAKVDGHIERTVVWADSVVHLSESLVDAIRFHGDDTVLVRGR